MLSESTEVVTLTLPKREHPNRTVMTVSAFYVSSSHIPNPNQFFSLNLHVLRLARRNWSALLWRNKYVSFETCRTNTSRWSRRTTFFVITTMTQQQYKIANRVTENGSSGKQSLIRWLMKRRQTQLHTKYSTYCNARLTSLFSSSQSDLECLTKQNTKHKTSSIPIHNLRAL